MATFVCLASKAVHFELVSDLTTEAFLASLKRFFSRRRKSSSLTSDHATNFVGANRKLAQLHELLLSNKRNEAVQQFLAKQRVSWIFIPPRSPHFDGLWEAGAKSFKPYSFLLFRPCDWDWGYFKFPSSFLLLPILLIVALWFLNISLIGEPLMSFSQANLSDIAVNRLSVWQHLQMLRQRFWTRWHMEYLNELTSRTKWKFGSRQCFSYRLNGGPEGRQHAFVVLEDRSHNLFPSWTRWSSNKSCFCENWGRYLQKKRKE